MPHPRLLFAAVAALGLLSSALPQDSSADDQDVSPDQDVSTTDVSSTDPTTDTLSSSDDLTTLAYGGATPRLTFLRQNDANWATAADHSGALLYHSTLANKDAVKACSALKEKLFDFSSSNYATSDIYQQFVYQRYLGDSNTSQAYWIAGSTTSKGTKCPAYVPGSSSAKSAKITQVSCASKLPTLCSSSAPAATNSPSPNPGFPIVVKDTLGYTFTGTRDSQSFVFKGIPYAAAPTGKNRFLPAKDYAGSKNIDATQFKTGCLQALFFNQGSYLNPYGTDEDCLFLNVWTPYIPSAVGDGPKPDPKPVFLWIHGGGNTWGTGSDATFDGGAFASRSDVVVVTINYRLGIFGYLSFGSDDVVSGNEALSDKIQALKWVQQHIAAFGGDPTRVTIGGQSAGGGSVFELLSTKKAAGLFASAIQESGGAGTVLPQAAVTGLTIPLAATVCGNATSTARLTCLQKLPASEMQTLQTQAPFAWGTVIDNKFLTDTPNNLFAKGKKAVNSVPLLAGGMPEENQSALSTISPNLTDFQGTLATLYNATFAAKVVGSGLWNLSETLFSPYAQVIDVSTDLGLGCSGHFAWSRAAASKAFPAMYTYSMKRAYEVFWYQKFGLCTFPVGTTDPHPKHFRCHLGDLYSVFNSAGVNGQPVRQPEDVAFFGLINDLWSSFMRSHDPNPEAAYLTARGYASTLAWTKSFTWPQFFGGKTGKVAALDWPKGTAEPLQDGARCDFLFPGN